MARSIGLDDAMDRAMSETFEGMTFCEVVREAPKPDDPEAKGNPDLFEGEDAAPVWARIAVRSPAAGTLLLAVDESFARRLEERVTGAESGDEADRLDSLAEVLNALAGRWASRLAPPSQPIVLGLPETGRGRWSQFDVQQWAVYVTDEEERIVVARIA